MKSTMKSTMKFTAKSTGGHRAGVATGGIGVILGTVILGLPIAQAQTVSRQITREPVETTITQYPDGTEITRRILSPEPSFSTSAGPMGTTAPLAGDALTPHYVEPAAPALARHQVTAGNTAVGAAPHAAPASRVASQTHTARTRVESTHAQAARRAAPSTVGQAVAPAASRQTVSDAALALSPAQRQAIYRTVVDREYVPAPDAGYPLYATYPAREPFDAAYVDRAYAYAPAPDYAYDPYTGYGVGYAYAERDPYHTAYRWDGVPLVVGARMPVSVPVALNVPVVQPYGYAVLDGRVYLVDPATRVIVAEINR